VTGNELKRKLTKMGCTFEQGTKHLIVYHNGKRTIMPRHDSKEIKPGTYKAILKQLGLKEK
jgi:mRNA interferase HicA